MKKERVKTNRRHSWLLLTLFLQYFRILNDYVNKDIPDIGLQLFVHFPLIFKLLLKQKQFLLVC